MPSVTLAPDLSSVAIARNFVMDVAEDRVPDIDAVVVVVSELVTNVFTHAHSAVTLNVRLGPPLRIEVADSGAATSAFRRLLDGCSMPDPTALGGRGLCIVRALATTVGLDIDPRGGKVVWFEM